MTKDHALQICSPVSTEVAKVIWDTSGSVGVHKNRQFKPQLNQSMTIIDQNKQICKDACLSQPRRFPMIFQTITPATYGKDFIRFTNGFA